MTSALFRGQLHLVKVFWTDQLCPSLVPKRSTWTFEDPLDIKAISLEIPSFKFGPGERFDQLIVEAKTQSRSNLLSHS